MAHIQEQRDGPRDAADITQPTRTCITQRDDRWSSITAKCKLLLQMWLYSATCPCYNYMPHLGLADEFLKIDEFSTTSQGGVSIIWILMLIRLK